LSGVRAVRYEERKSNVLADRYNIFVNGFCLGKKQLLRNGIARESVARFACDGAALRADFSQHVGSVSREWNPPRPIL